MKTYLQVTLKRLKGQVAAVIMEHANGARSIFPNAQMDEEERQDIIASDVGPKPWGEVSLWSGTQAELDAIVPTHLQ